METCPFFCAFSASGATLKKIFFKNPNILLCAYGYIYMEQSIVKNYVHIVFSTKKREPVINVLDEKDLHSYIGDICKVLDCPPVKIGGCPDHIHVLCMLSQNISLNKLVSELKCLSAKWMQARDSSFSKFCWQEGYGAFSVNPTEVDIVVSYIANQKEHHVKRTYKDEYRIFLKQYKIEYNEGFVWD